MSSETGQVLTAAEHVNAEDCQFSGLVW